MQWLPPAVAVLRSRAVETSRALADLVEISPQIEAAVVLEGDGETVGSVGVSDWWATAAGRAGHDLLNAASELRGEAESRVTQIHAALSDGDVFAVVGDAGRAIVAVTAARQAPGLVFYDLKRCLASLAEPKPEPKPEPAPQPEEKPASRRRRWGRRREESGEA